MVEGKGQTTEVGGRKKTISDFGMRIADLTTSTQ